MEDPQERQGLSSECDDPESGKLEQRSWSKFENTKSTKVGMFCLSMSEEYGEIKIYLLDLDSDSDCYGGPGGGDEFKNMRPAIRIHGQNLIKYEAFCAQGSSLYLFEGGRPFRRDPEPDLKEKSAAKIVLTPDLLESAMAGGGCVDKGDEIFEKVPDMRQIKCQPEALPAPDGRHILVFSTVFLGPPIPPHTEFDPSHPAFADTAFELYDTVTNTWIPLPEFPFPAVQDMVWFPSPSLGDMVTVGSFSFLNESVFFVDTSRGGFTLDIESRVWTCTRVQVPHRVKGYFVAPFGGQFALLPRVTYKSDDNIFVFKARSRVGAVTWLEHVRTSASPLSQFSPPNTPPWMQLTYPSILPLHHHPSRHFDTCTLQTEAIDADESAKVRLLIDVRRTHLDDLRTEILNTIKIKIDYLNSFGILALFPLLI